MIKKQDFYGSNDSPGQAARERMWRAIRRSSGSLRRDPWIVRDRRSFVFGMAATVVLGLAIQGAWSIPRQALENAQPEPLRVERAYIEAIREFERVVPSSTVQNSASPQSASQMKDRREELKLINAAIADLRSETNGRDLSPLKRERLRELYSQELTILQQMVEHGEIEL